MQVLELQLHRKLSTKQNKVKGEVYHYYTTIIHSFFKCVCVRVCGFHNDIDLSGRRHCAGFGGFHFLIMHHSAVENFRSQYVLHACLPNAVCLWWACICVATPLSLWGLMCLHQCVCVTATIYAHPHVKHAGTETRYLPVVGAGSGRGQHISVLFFSACFSTRNTDILITIWNVMKTVSTSELSAYLFRWDFALVISRCEHTLYGGTLFIC